VSEVAKVVAEAVVETVLVAVALAAAGMIVVVNNSVAAA
jgi:hypothetical protein